MNNAEPPSPQAPSASTDTHHAEIDPHAYRIVRGDIEKDAQTILTLWRAGLGHDGSPDGKFNWYYRNNPAGLPMVLFLEHIASAQFVGVAALAQRQLSVHGAPMPAGEMVDFVVKPEHRSLMPAMMIMRSIYEHGLVEHDFLYGLPNAKSRAVVKRVGYKHFGDMKNHVRVLRSADYLRQRLPRALGWLAGLAGSVADHVRRLRMRQLARQNRFAGAWMDVPDRRFDDLWLRAKDRMGILGQRDRAFLHWRFVDCPLRKHRFFVLVDNASQALIGYAVCEQADNALHVHDFLVDPAQADAFIALWAQLADQAYGLGCASMVTEFYGSDQVHRALGQAGLTQRRQRSLCGMVSPSHQDLLDTTQWYMTSADEDG